MLRKRAGSHESRHGERTRVVGRPQQWPLNRLRVRTRRWYGAGMFAVLVKGVGGEGVLELGEVPDPVPEKGEVLVRVSAAAVNRADILQRRGLYPAPSDAPQNILGLEFAGEVLSRGPDAGLFAPGDRVFGLVGGGAYAEKVAVHERTLVRVPDAMPLVEAAAIPEAFVTAFDSCMMQGQLRMGEELLVHAVGSGVGTAAVQLGAAAGARVFGTARTRDKLARARALGLDEAVLVSDGKFANEILSRTGGIDLALDLVGGPYVAENLRVMRKRGRIALVGLLGGREAPLAFAEVLQKRITLFGTVLRSRPLEEKIAVTQAFAHQVLPLFGRGKLRAVVHKVFSVEEVREAHRLMESNELFGKVVLSLGGARKKS